MAEVKKKRKVKKWVWVVGWILCFPIPLTAIIVKSAHINKIVKGIIISFLWFFVLVWTAFIATYEPSDENISPDPQVSQVASVIDEIDYKEKFEEEIGDTGVSGPDKVYQDVTGKWRVTLIYSDKDFIPYAPDYYHGYFESDDEIHAIINLYLKTTTKLTVSGVYLNATVYEYIDGEEHSANTLFSGMQYSSYTINKVTGEYEKYDMDWDYIVVNPGSSIEEASATLLDNRGYSDYTVHMEDKTLVVEFQKLPTLAGDKDDKDIAFLTTLTFTDDFLEQYNNDEEWDMIIVRFIGVGEYRLTKDLILDSDGSGRFFNFFVDDIISG